MSQCPLWCSTVSLVTVGKIIKIYEGVFHKSFLHFLFDFTQGSGSALSFMCCNTRSFQIFHLIKNQLSVEVKTMNQLSAEPLSHAMFRESAHLHATSPPEAPFASIRSSTNARLLMCTWAKERCCFLSGNGVQDCSYRSSLMLHLSGLTLFGFSLCLFRPELTGSSSRRWLNPKICVTGDI